ncbi:nucleoside hydrolase [Ornithinibacillus californiensis]|uniref:nucleoside hydrolase n=1 Tax=Ornithinibacillus californiensis TaxID=161536 RepID=UPI00064D886C|nr:nucleoside hydrolase [Ornithinibacillus californiensis]
MRIPVIIDCDPGIDDVMALLFAFVRTELDILLITTEAGNQTQAKTTYNARSFLSYMNQEIEVARGLEQPLFQELEVAEDVHGESGLGDVIFPEPDFEESSRSAIQALYERITKSPEPVVLIATGPLTNIGALFLAHPEVKAKIRYISFMGGAAVGGNMTPTAEFNVYVDPHAADIVFRSGVPIVMSGLDVTHKAFLDESDLKEIEEIGTELSDRLVELMKFYRRAAKQTAFHEEGFATNIRLHDLCAVAYVVEPNLFQGDDCYVAIETEGKLTKGTTVVDYTQSLPYPKNVHVLHTVKRKEFVDRFIEAIQKAEQLIKGGKRDV